MKMPEKTSLASYITGVVMVIIGKLGRLLNDLTLNDWAIVIRSPVALDKYERVYFTDGKYPKVTSNEIATQGM